MYSYCFYYYAKTHKYFFFRCIKQTVLYQKNIQLKNLYNSQRQYFVVSSVSVFCFCAEMVKYVVQSLRRTNKKSNTEKSNGKKYFLSKIGVYHYVNLDICCHIEKKIWKFFSEGPPPYWSVVRHRLIFILNAPPYICI